jgi:hypothetical protein
MLSSYDKRSVRYVIEQSDLRERDFIEARAKMEIDIINSQCLNRALTDSELRAFEFAIETISQLETRHHREDGCYEMKRRGRLM